MIIQKHFGAIHFCRRSRDVAKLHADMNFDINKINVQQPTCQIHGKDTVCVKAEVCFTYHIKTEKETNPETREAFHISVLVQTLIFRLYDYTHTQEDRM